MPDGVALSLTVVRTLSGGNDKDMYIIGGRRLDQNFLASLVPPAGTRALLYRNLEPNFVAAALTDVNGSFEQADRLQPLIEQIQKQPKPTRANYRLDRQRRGRRILSCDSADGPQQRTSCRAAAGELAQGTRTVDAPHFADRWRLLQERRF